MNYIRYLLDQSVRFEVPFSYKKFPFLNNREKLLLHFRHCPATTKKIGKIIILFTFEKRTLELYRTAQRHVYANNSPVLFLTDVLSLVIHKINVFFFFLESYVSPNAGPHWKVRRFDTDQTKIPHQVIICISTRHK